MAKIYIDGNTEFDTDKIPASILKEVAVAIILDGFKALRWAYLNIGRDIKSKAGLSPLQEKILNEQFFRSSLYVAYAEVVGFDYSGPQLIREARRQTHYEWMD